MLEKEPKIKDTILEITALRGKNRFTSEEDSLHQKSDHNVYKDFIKLFKLIIYFLKKDHSPMILTLIMLSTSFKAFSSTCQLVSIIV